MGQCFCGSDCGSVSRIQTPHELKHGFRDYCCQFVWPSLFSWGGLPSWEQLSKGVRVWPMFAGQPSNMRLAELFPRTLFSKTYIGGIKPPDGGEWSDQGVCHTDMFCVIYELAYTDVGMYASFTSLPTQMWVCIDESSSEGGRGVARAHKSPFGDSQ